jgi:hypothetical protein
LLSGIVVVGGLLIFFTSMSGFSAAKSLAPQMGVAAMAVSLIATPLVSLVTKKFEASHVENVFKSL